jgi:thiamine-monophosphate kinase
MDPTAHPTPPATLSGDDASVLPPPGVPVSAVGEFGLIRRLSRSLSQSPAVTVGPGDDAAEVEVSGARVLVATDVLVEGRHFRRDWSTAADIGHRAAAQSLSDLNAMGGVATAVTVGLATPAEVDARWVLELAGGIAEECALVGASVVGGDLTRSDAVVVSVTAVGSAGGAVLLRSGARSGQVVAVRGRLGWAAAGLAVLGRGFRSPRAVVEAYRRPEVPYAAGAEALVLGATAAVDVSDGLLADLGHVAEASGVAVDLDADAFVAAEPVAAVGAALGLDPLALMLTGGDDHALVATFPADAELPAAWTVVGTVAASGEDGPGVTVGGRPWEGERGYQHF